MDAYGRNRVGVAGHVLASMKMAREGQISAQGPNQPEHVVA